MPDANVKLSRCLLAGLVFSLPWMVPGGLVLADEVYASCATRLVDRGLHLELSTSDQEFRDRADTILIWMLAAARVDPACAGATGKF